MPQYAASARRLECASEAALQQGLSELSRAALDLDAQIVAVLVVEPSSVDLVYRWADSSDAAPMPEPIVCAAEIKAELIAASGAVSAERPVARFLISTLSCRANSFLLFPWRAGRRAVSIVFGFDAGAPAGAAVPARIAGHLNLAALAAWSWKEVDHLRKELRAINGRFAGRKLVDRVKSMLQTQRGMSEPEAYAYLRTLSRQRRVTMIRLAEILLGSARWP